MADYNDPQDLDDTDEDQESEKPKTSGMKQLRDSFESAKAENSRLKRENALLKAGLGDLGGKKTQALLAAHDGDLTAEALKATATELGFITSEPDEAQQQADQAADAATRLADSSQGAAPSIQTGVLTPTEVNDWPPDKIMRLNEQHPDEFERLMRGETVTGLAFT